MIFKEHGLKFDKRHMETLGLCKKDEYTNLAFMLSDQFDVSIKMAVYRDGSKTSFVSRRIISGSLLVQFRDALDFIDLNNRLSSEIIGYKRVDKLQFPQEAIREAILNAIIHRDYAIDGSTLVCIYPDRLTITSPGALNECYSLEDLKLGVSSSRNPLLANIFYRLKYCETYGSGIPRIINCYSGHKSPTFIVGTSVFHVELPCMDAGELEPVYELLKSADSISRKDVEKIGYSRLEALSIISDLIKNGKLTPRGGERSTRYLINK